ncbi:MAG: heterodisulfide reductase subunit B [Deltaproteobacteria bacterium RBG_13_61_14]|nr:MAG: heterodisulfide reductase subunit B [Deltaproteobacteria bacterium RBG_13_61_14]
MKLGYFPGCSLQGSAGEFDESLQAIAPALGLELIEIPDWSCCGASAAHNLNRLLALALPARTLALAERAGFREVLVPCSACYSRLILTRHELEQDEGLRRQVSEIIGMEYQGTVRVLNILEVMGQIFQDGLKGKITKPFEHPVACYYGCLLVRPPKVVQFDRPEDPRTMDELMKKIGAEPIDWAFKVECCGAGFSISRTDLVAKLSSKILADAQRRGAEAIIVACPMCHANLDMRQEKAEKWAGKKYSMPVLYLTQAIGLALGLPEKKLALHQHLVPVSFPVKAKPAAKAKAETASQPAGQSEE